MKAEIWTWRACPYCKKAKQILKKNKIEFTEHVMDHNQAELTKIQHKYDHYTVPIILLGRKFIGGCDELIELEKSGKLN
ncbi:MAG: glutaredoxin [uncultured DHVE6 group euryarchaeote]|jgi:glutaredoxin 3|nr:MAG: glutaredoxin [uncultured DHVE6 group euryarchaeote]